MGQKIDNSAKGNPAHRRMSNETLKRLRARSYVSGVKRRAERVAAQLQAKKDNVWLKENGQLTPWEEAKAKRAARRAADPMVAQSAREHRREAGALS